MGMTDPQNQMQATSEKRRKDTEKKRKRKRKENITEEIILLVKDGMRKEQTRIHRTNQLADHF